MSAPERFLVLVLALLGGPVGPGAGAPVVPEPRPGGEILLPGRLPWGATALPSGEILAPCEDQTVSVLDARARVLARWNAPGRVSAPVTVGPRGTLELAAVPQVTGRVDILVWDPQSRVLAPVFGVDNPSEAVATAWDASGSVHLAWRSGRIEAWSSKGVRAWGTDLGLPLSALLVDDSLGVYAFGTGTAVLLDPRGREVGRWTLPGTPRGVLQTMAGDLYCWTESGLWRKDLDGPGFRLFDPSTQLLGVCADRQDRLILTDPGRIRRLAPGGYVLSSTPLPRTALTAAVVDDRGRTVVGTVGGLEVWAYDGRFLGTLDPVPPASAALVTERGLGVWSSSDWTVRVWSGFRLPPYGWAQAGGREGRSFSARRPASVAARAVNWADDPDFAYFFQLAASGKEGLQKEALDRLEATPGNLLEARPWANLILIKVARSGLTDLVTDRGQVSNANNWPQNRLRAFTLLAQTAQVEDRDELVAVLLKEFDPAVAARGALALARSGWDGDGKLMRLLSDLHARLAGQAVLADACVDAARSLWEANGQSADPAMATLVTSVFQGPYPRTVKNKAQTLFQDILSTP